jgi:hypothetical protein
MGSPCLRQGEAAHNVAGPHVDSGVGSKKEIRHDLKAREGPFGVRCD